MDTKTLIKIGEVAKTFASIECIAYLISCYVFNSEYSHFHFLGAFAGFMTSAITFGVVLDRAKKEAKIDE